MLFPAYISRHFKQFLQSFPIKHITGIPYNPQTQDIVKRTHHTLKLQIKKNFLRGYTQVHYCLPYLKQTLLDSDIFSKPITIVNAALFVFNFFNLFLRFEPRGPPAFKMEMKQEPQEEIPIWAMSALKNSKKHRPRRHHPDDLLTWRQI